MSASAVPGRHSSTPVCTFEAGQPPPAELARAQNRICANEAFGPCRAHQCRSWAHRVQVASRFACSPRSVGNSWLQQALPSEEEIQMQARWGCQHTHSHADDAARDPKMLQCSAARRALASTLAALLAMHSSGCQASPDLPADATAAHQQEGCGAERIAHVAAHANAAHYLVKDATADPIMDIAGLFDTQAVDEKDPVEPFTLYGTILCAPRSSGQCI